jgi:hypothetical protein
VAANTSDHRVGGKIRRSSLHEVRLRMKLSYPDENYRKSRDCYSRRTKKLSDSKREIEKGRTLFTLFLASLHLGAVSQTRKEKPSESQDRPFVIETSANIAENVSKIFLCRHPSPIPAIYCMA